MQTFLIELLLGIEDLVSSVVKLTVRALLIFSALPKRPVVSGKE